MFPVSEQNQKMDPLEALIQQKEREFRPLKWRMEELRIQFINELTEFAAKWYNGPLDTTLPSTLKSH